MKAPIQNHKNKVSTKLRTYKTHVELEKSIFFNSLLSRVEALKRSLPTRQSVLLQYQKYLVAMTHTFDFSYWMALLVKWETRLKVKYSLAAIILRYCVFHSSVKIYSFKNIYVQQLSVAFCLLYQKHYWCLTMGTFFKWMLQVPPSISFKILLWGTESHQK